MLLCFAFLFLVLPGMLCNPKIPPPASVSKGEKRVHFLVRTMSNVDTNTTLTQALKQERQLLLWRVVGASFSKTPIPRSTVLSENIKTAERASFGDRGPGNAQKGTRMSVRKRDFALHRLLRFGCFCCHARAQWRRCWKGKGELKLYVATFASYLQHCSCSFSPF